MAIATPFFYFPFLYRPCRKILRNEFGDMAEKNRGVSLTCFRGVAGRDFFTSLKFMCNTHNPAVSYSQFRLAAVLMASPLP